MNFVILVQKKSMHPYLGTERTEELEFEDLSLARKKFDEWSKSDCDYQQTTVYIRFKQKQQQP